MSELLYTAAFGICLSVVAYSLGVYLQKKTGLVIFNGLLVAGVIIIALLLALDIPFEAYNVGGSIISLFVTPMTVCMGLSIYRNLPLLKKRLIPILAGAFAGSLTAIVTGLVLCRLLGMDEAMTMSLLPRSVTNPVAIAISAQKGGVVSITVAAVAIAGMGGNLIAPWLCRLFRTRDSVEAGLAIGACSHAIGTARALELGETEGAMSGLAIGLCGIITAILALPLCSML
jgi:putative effector of murein hydrolase